MEVPDFLNTRLPLLSLRVRGAWKKDKIFQVIHGKQTIRTYSEYDGSAKGHLIKFQSKFAAAVWRWQQMPYNERRWFISRAAKLGLQISGYNYFISLYMRNKLEDAMGYPDPHHLSHEKDGDDEISVEDLLGVLEDPQKSAWLMIADRPDEFVPINHATSHETDGVDPLDLSDQMIKYAITLGG